MIKTGRKITKKRFPLNPFYGMPTYPLKGILMGKVITNRIIVINKEEPILLKKEPSTPPVPMHFNEEQVLVFDKDGNCVGNVGHDEVEEPF